MSKLHSFRHPVNLFSVGLSEGFTPERMAPLFGWTTRMAELTTERFKEVVSTKIIRPEDAWAQYESAVRAQIVDLQKIKEAWEQGEVDATTRTVQEHEGNRTKIVRKHTPSRGGISSSDYTTACALIARLAKEYVETGIRLGVFPSTPAAPQQLNVYQILIDSVREGDWEKVRQLSDGRLPHVRSD